jgi:hypothetical protein
MQYWKSPLKEGVNKMAMEHLEEVKEVMADAFLKDN